MPSRYTKTGRSHTKEYKAEYRREWMKRQGNKDKARNNLLNYYKRKLSDSLEQETKNVI